MKKTHHLTLIALMSAVMCILGPFTIVIPFSPVPISFMSFAVYLSVVLLGMKKGTASYIIYLLIGFVGVPVFSGFSAGPAKLLGPTGGYLIGFIFLCLISGAFLKRFPGKTVMTVLGMLCGTVVCYAFGTAWLCYQAGLTIQTALMVGTLPYIPGDCIKIAFAIIFARKMRLKGIELPD